MSNGAIAMIVGTVAFAYGIFCLFRMFSSRNWASAGGRIVTSHKSLTSTDAGTMADAEIEYEYEVEGKQYRSRVVKSGGDASSSTWERGRTEVDKVLARYPIGREVTVYYHPRMPQMACLEKAGGEVLLITLILGPVAIIVGYFFL